MNGSEQVQRTCMQLDPKQCSKTMVAWRYVVAPPGRQGRQGRQSRTIVTWRYVVAPPSSNSSSNSSGGGSSSSRCRLKLSYVFLRRRCLACLFISLQLDAKQCSKTMVAWRYVVAPPGRQGRQGRHSRTIVTWRYAVAPPSSNSNSNSSGGSSSSSSRCRLKLSYVFLRRRCLACLFISLCATPGDAA